MSSLKFKVFNGLFASSIISSFEGAMRQRKLTTALSLRGKNIIDSEELQDLHNKACISCKDKKKREDKDQNGNVQETKSLFEYIDSYCPSWLKEHEEDLPGWYNRPKSCIHHVTDSLFSSSSGFNNYRGFLNLGIILLVVSNARVALENLLKYGILMDPFHVPTIFLRYPFEWPSFLAVISQGLFFVMALKIEQLLSKGSVQDRTGMYLHLVNMVLGLLTPSVYILYVHPLPIFSSAALGICSVIFLKLCSYVQVNRWCRLSKAQNTLKRKRNKSVSYSLGDYSSQNDSSDSVDGMTRVVYPDNLTLTDMVYFVAAPTLCYELNFPRSNRIRKRFLLKRIAEMILLGQLVIGLVQQWIMPTVNNALRPFRNMELGMMLERMLKLAVPNHLIWLIFFYWFFHSTLNVVAEITRFGDREFYRDWWNSTSVPYFWKNWNIPVHRWATRHVYKPMLKMGYKKITANVMVFVVSAFFHELLVSVPLRMFRLWAFSAMVFQVPFAILVDKYCSEVWGNVSVWISLIIGQPIAILMYYHDYYVESLEAAT